MEQIDNQLHRLLTLAAQFSKLANDYAAAEHEPIAAKLFEVAADFEAKAAGLEARVA